MLLGWDYQAGITEKQGRQAGREGGVYANEDYAFVSAAVDTNILVAPEPQTWYNGFTGTLDCRTKDQIITWTTPRTDRNEVCFLSYHKSFIVIIINYVV